MSLSEESRKLLERVPVELRPTTDELEKANELQSILRLKIIGPQRSLSREEQSLSYAEKDEEMLKAFLENIPSTETERIADAKDRLAEALTIQGKFEEALEYAQGTSRTSEIEKMQNAITRPDTDTCSCDNTVHGLSGAEIPRKFIERLQYVPHRGVFLPVVVCSKCGLTNVTENIGDSLARVDAARASVSQKTPDNELLKRAVK